MATMKYMATYSPLFLWFNFLTDLWRIIYRIFYRRSITSVHYHSTSL